MRNFHVCGGNIIAEHTKAEIKTDEALTHCHDKFELFYVINGEGKCIVEGVEYTIRPKTLFIFAPLTCHVLCFDEKTVLDTASVFFDKSSLNDNILGSLNNISLKTDSFCPAAVYNVETIYEHITSSFERFIKTNEFPEKEKEIYFGLLTSELIMLASMADSEKRSSDDKGLGARVIRYLNEYGHKNISLDELARHFFVSKFYLCRAFKAHNGISLHGYINCKRVMHAKQLIDSGETASRAAYQVGYGDYSAFYRAYVKLIGKAPTD